MNAILEVSGAGDYYYSNGKIVFNIVYEENLLMSDFDGKQLVIRILFGLQCRCRQMFVQVEFIGRQKVYDWLGISQGYESQIQIQIVSWYVGFRLMGCYNVWLLWYVVVFMVCQCTKNPFS
eukprot:TRINITY_DN3784_c0_g1_i2.p2 TRINITY_DN3784_c0_g1~~TRINITY_DN3784_c0_g1_i2.p2  ORF type:complete len:121 (-),score=7.98 TRINITY_DN3784_c0_g1_i2:46-408(-)